MASLSPQAPPVRHGKARLEVTINGQTYTARRAKGPDQHTRVWVLKKPDGTSYGVGRRRGQLVCTCPDHTRRGAACKHQRALVALGLLSGRRPSPAKGGAL